MKKKLILILLLLLSFCLVSCTNDNGNREPNENEIKDASNRIVEIPSDPLNSRIASVYAVASPFFVALNISDRVVACNTKKAFYKNEDPGLKKSSTCGNGVVDLEKLASLNPTVLIHRNNDSKTIEKVSKLGIDIITIEVENMDDVKNTLRMLGKYFGVSERAEYVCSYIDDQFEFIDSIVNTIPESERKTAILMGGEPGRVAGADMLQSFMINKAGGISLINESKNHSWINIGIEKVFEYNPEYLFLTSSTALDYSIESLFNDSAWSAVNAVVNKNIYQIPAKNDSWDLPGLSPILGTLYMLKKMYPEYLSDELYKEKIDEYYYLMFNKTYTFEELGYEGD